MSVPSTTITAQEKVGHAKVMAMLMSEDRDEEWESEYATATFEGSVEMWQSVKNAIAIVVEREEKRREEEHRSDEHPIGTVIESDNKHKSMENAMATITGYAKKRERVGYTNAELYQIREECRSVEYTTTTFEG
ncbi:hypothetical protein K439DRAFT_1616278 [Ramaria rubella]|nr:hypothetical protein K439DRAFT_1616278 [Ramaria rubella]